MALSKQPLRRVNRKVYNRYFTDVTAAITTLSVVGLSWTPGTDWLIKSAKLTAILVPVGGTGSQAIPVRWAMTGAMNQQLDGAVDTLPGLAFDNNTVWGVNPGNAKPLQLEWTIPAGTTITFSCRAYSPPPGAFAVNDVVHFYLEIEYEEIYAFEALGGLQGLPEFNR